ncbi:MAG: tripartite tricarboxylate transporter substrate binding protein, partial [Alphaproteobacteria bacterium]|nr:tripartite tricarboxylate transporter substrate binding protein [Alphaproteobacteria bacterium]
GDYISQKTGQPVTVENKAGASGAIAAEQVKSAAPDGYTLMWTISTTMIMNKVLFKKLPYDPDKDFVPISWMDAGHLPTIVSKNVPATNLKEFEAYARNNKVSLGTYGAGSYSHVAVEALNRHYGLKMEAVHYRGEAPMWIDVASGSVQGGSGSVAAASSVLQTGSGRAIAVPTKARMRKLPDVGTFLEQGLTDIAFQVQGFICLVGPAAMPKDIVRKLSDMMVEGGKSERIQKILETFGIDTPAQDHVFFEKILAEQGPIWLDLVRGLGLEPQ